MRKDKYCIELTEEYIKKNRDEIIRLLRSIGREGIELSILMPDLIDGEKKERWHKVRNRISAGVN